MNRQDFQENGKRYTIEWEGSLGVGSVPGALSSLIERTCGDGTEADKLAKAKAWCLAAGVTRLNIDRHSDGYGFVFHMDVDAKGRTFAIDSTVIVREPSGRCLEATVLEPLANDIGRPYWPRVVNAIGGEPYNVNPKFVLTREEWIATLREGDDVEAFRARDRSWIREVVAEPVTTYGVVAMKSGNGFSMIRPVRATTANTPARHCRLCSTPITKFNDGGGLRCLACESSGASGVRRGDEMKWAPPTASATRGTCCASFGCANVGDVHSDDDGWMCEHHVVTTIAELRAMNAAKNETIEKYEARHAQMKRHAHENLDDDARIQAGLYATIAALTERLRLATQPTPSRERGAGLLMVAEMKGIGR